MIGTLPGHPYARGSHEHTEWQSSVRKGPGQINLFPTELLERVFELGSDAPLQTDPHYPLRPLFSKAPHTPLFALSVSAVCRRWRHTAIQTQKLWATLHLSRSVDAHRRLRPNLGRSLEWISTYLARSHDGPLHITLDTTRLPLEAVLDLINPLSHRWTSLTLLVTHVGALPATLAYFIHVRAPKLRFLSILSDIYREGIVSYEAMIPFLIHPTIELDSICLHGVYLDWNNPPLSSLTALELRYATRWPIFPQLQSLLDASPALKSLIIHDDVNAIVRNVAQPVGQAAIRLLALKHFEIKTLHVREKEANILGLMRMFSMPALETLVFIGLRMVEWERVSQAYHLPRNPSDFSPMHRRSQFIDLEDAAFPCLSTLIVRN